ncbi:hypothetical protein [Mycobacterium sp. DL99]|uniref:hypothetical protein n=1 Tax=Mycobacterium sp. DL99 TaxID=2528957 RepID=UPI00108151B0|nr:hypothetical protein [Mycobacterium sp. DL99]
MSDQLRQRFERVIHQHYFVGVARKPMGMCGDPDGCDWTGTHMEHIGHVADVLLSLPDVAVVELASQEEMEDYGLSVTPLHGDAFGLPVAEEVPDEKGMTRTRFRSVSETSSYAAALLAAAHAAEIGADR